MERQRQPAEIWVRAERPCHLPGSISQDEGSPLPGGTASRVLMPWVGKEPEGLSRGSSYFLGRKHSPWGSRRRQPVSSAVLRWGAAEGCQYK